MSVQKKIINLYYIIFSLFAALMLTMSFADPTVGTEYHNFFAAVTDNLKKSFSGTGIISTVLFAVLYYISIKNHSKSLIYKKTVAVFSAVIAVFWLMGASFFVNNDLHSIVSSPGQIVKSIIYLCGAYYLIYVVSSLFNHILEEHSKPSHYFLFKDPKNGTSKFLTSHKKLTVSAGLLLFWAFPVITAFPANMCSDSWTQLAQYWGHLPFNANNPPFHSLVIGLFTRLGSALGNPDLGLFLMVVIQTVIFAAVISYSFELMDHLNAPSWLQIISFFTAALSPYYVSYTATILKDVPFSICALLFMLELIYAVHDFSSFISDTKHIILAFAAALGSLLFRNNGMYLVYPIFLILIIILFVKHKHLEKKHCIKAAVLIIASIVAAFALKTSAIKICNIESGSIKESLSFPFQQTARTVKEHPDSITDEEIAVIDKVLVYDTLADNYLPTISDPVKDRMRQEASSKDLINYLKTWFKMFFKYPKSYIVATANQNYVLVYPFQKLDTFYISYSLKEGRHLPLAEYPGFKGCTIFKAEKDILSGWYRFLFSAPVIGLLSHPAFYMLILFFTMLLAICKKKAKYLLICIPLFFTGVGIIFAPCLIGHPRYAFPVIYSIPAVLAYYIYIIRNDKPINNPAR